MRGKINTLRALHFFVAVPLTNVKLLIVPVDIDELRYGSSRLMRHNNVGGNMLDTPHTV